MTSGLFLPTAIRELQKLKRLADKAIAQAPGEAFTATLDPESNSIAILVKHVAGNMESRWTDFLTSDGEKPWRERDREFIVEEADTRERLLERWEKAWGLMFETLGSLRDEDLDRTVTIREDEMAATDAILRQLAHYAGHVGQIVLLAKHYAGTHWKTLSVPRGGTAAFNASQRRR